MSYSDLGASSARPQNVQLTLPGCVILALVQKRCVRPPCIPSAALTVRSQDYINPIDLCNRLNAFVLPEHGVHAFLCLLFVLSFQWTCIIFNAPLLAFNINKSVLPSCCARLTGCRCRIITNNWTHDATEIFRTLGGHKKESFFKLAFYLACFFYYLYRCVPIRRPSVHVPVCKGLPRARPRIRLRSRNC